MFAIPPLLLPHPHCIVAALALRDSGANIDEVNIGAKRANSPVAVQPHRRRAPSRPTVQPARHVPFLRLATQPSLAMLRCTAVVELGEQAYVQAFQRSDAAAARLWVMMLCVAIATAQARVVSDSTRLHVLEPRVSWVRRCWPQRHSSGNSRSGPGAADGRLCTAPPLCHKHRM